MNETINLVHKKDLEIISTFIQICNKNKLNYYIIGGTFLGAVRHKGFIPWDDDMDIAMPREDYNKFINIFNEENNLKLLNYNHDNNYKYYISRLCDMNYEITENSGNKTNLFVDIFPIDGFPKNNIIRKIHIFRILYHRMKLSFYYSDTIDMNAKRSLFERILIKIAKSIKFNKIIKPSKEKKKLDKILEKYSFYSSKYVGTIMGAYRQREIVPVEYFGKPTLYIFENMKLYGPEKYDLYLKHIYGDYMKLPSEEERRIHLKEIKKLGKE